MSIVSERSTAKDKLISRAFKQFSQYLHRAQLLSVDAMNTAMKLALDAALKELHDNPRTFGLSPDTLEGSGQLVAAFALKSNHPTIAEAQRYRNLVRFYSVFTRGSLPAVQSMIKDHLKDEVLARWVESGTDAIKGNCGPVLFR